MYKMTKHKKLLKLFYNFEMINGTLSSKLLDFLNKCDWYNEYVHNLHLFNILIHYN